MESRPSSIDNDELKSQNELLEESEVVEAANCPRTCCFKSFDNRDKTPLPILCCNPHPKSRSQFSLACCTNYQQSPNISFVLESVKKTCNTDYMLIFNDVGMSENRLIQVEIRPNKIIATEESENIPISEKSRKVLINLRKEDKIEDVGSDSE